jgi:hypothetical protein
MQHAQGKSEMLTKCWSSNLTGREDLGIHKNIKSKLILGKEGVKVKNG